MDQSQDGHNTRTRAPYSPPKLRSLGTIGDVTRAEGSGPGGFNFGGPSGGVTIHIETETWRRANQ